MIYYKNSYKEKLNNLLDLLLVRLKNYIDQKDKIDQYKEDQLNRKV